MNCKNCGQEVSENDNFCLHCGQKIEKEITCQNCGHILSNVANFCPNCGTKIATDTPIKAEVVATEIAPKQVVEKPIMETVKPINTVNAEVSKFAIPTLLLLAILSLFICSFFIGSYVSIGGVRAEEVGFQFLGETFDELNASLIEAKKVMTSTQYIAYEANLKTPLVFRAVIFIANIVIIALSLFIALVKFVNSYNEKKECNVTSCVGISFASFLATALLCKSYAYISIDIGEVFKNGMTAGSLIGLILASIFIFITFIVSQTRNKNSFLSSENLKRLIPATLLLVFTIIIANTSFNFIKLETATDVYDSFLPKTVAINLSPIAFYNLSTLSIIDLWGNSKKHTALMNQFVTDGQYGFAFYLITLLFVALLMYFVIKILIGDKKFNVLTGSCLALTGIVLIIQYIISTACVSSLEKVLELDGDAVVCSSNCTVLLIFGIIALVSIVIYWIASFKSENSYYFKQQQ